MVILARPTVQMKILQKFRALYCHCVRGFILPVMLLAVFNSPLYAKAVTLVKITAFAGATNFNDIMNISGIVMSSLSVKSSGNKNVRGYLELSSQIADTVSFDIPRAYIKVRFPKFRVTLGKNRVSWGEGFLFNSGDVIFEGADLIQNLSYNDLRAETAWLADFYIPLGLFSFAEAIALPFPANAASGTAASLVPWDSGRYGGRLAAELAGIKLEVGGIYGKVKIKPYISMQGHLFADLYADCGIILPENVWDGPEAADIFNSIKRAVKDTLTVTGGFFRQFNANPYGAVTVRTEVKLLPYGEWKQAESAVSGVDPGYGLYIYPELIYAPDSTLSLSIRSLVSPIDLSGIFFSGLSWNIYQGLNILIQGAVQFGEESDIWGWGRNGSLSCALGLEYRY